MEKRKGEEAVSDIKILTMNVKSAFNVILKDKKSFSDSVAKLEKTNAYKELLRKYPVVENPEHKSMLYSILIRMYQGYIVSSMVENIKQ